MELKTSADTPEASSVQKAADFVQAFLLGMLQAGFSQQSFCVKTFTSHMQVIRDVATQANHALWGLVSLLL